MGNLLPTFLTKRFRNVSSLNADCPWLNLPLEFVFFYQSVVHQGNFIVPVVDSLFPVGFELTFSRFDVSTSERHALHGRVLTDREPLVVSQLIVTELALVRPPLRDLSQVFVPLKGNHICGLGLRSWLSPVLIALGHFSPQIVVLRKDEILIFWT